jgi:uncharacterized OB-fold protein
MKKIVKMANGGDEKKREYTFVTCPKCGTSFPKGSECPKCSSEKRK